MNSLRSKLEGLGLRFSDTPCEKALFIMGDGSFLNLCENKMAVQGAEAHTDHCDFASFQVREGMTELPDKAYLTREHRVVQANMGVGEWNHEVAYLRLPVRISRPQLEAISKWLEILFFGTKKKHLAIEGEGLYKEYDIEGTEPSDILSDIAIRLSN